MVRLDRRFFAMLATAGLVVSLVLAAPFYMPDADLVVRRNGEAAAYIGADFVNMWHGGRLALAGDLGALFDFSRYNAALRESLSADIPFHNWSYPPHMLLLVAPFGLLPYPAALALWQAVTFGAFLWSIWPLAGAPQRWTVLAAGALTAASVVNFLGGQNGFLVAGLLIGGFRLLDGRPVVAGLLFGLLTIKPHLGLALPAVLLALGAWRAIAAAILATAGLVLASILLFGFDAWASFLTVTTQHQTGLLEETRGFYLLMMPGALVAARIAGAGLNLAIALWAIVAAIAVALAATGARRTGDFATRAALTALAAALASPYFFNYDMVAGSASLVLALARRTETRLGDFIALWTALLLPALVFPLNMIGLPIGPFVLMAALLAIRPRDDENPTLRVAAPVAPPSAS